MSRPTGYTICPIAVRIDPHADFPGPPLPGDLAWEGQTAIFRDRAAYDAYIRLERPWVSGGYVTDECGIPRAVARSELFALPVAMHLILAVED